MSNGLQEFVAYYSNKLSYSEGEELLMRITGEKLLSDQNIWELVVNKAVEISQKWQQEIEDLSKSELAEIAIAPTVDIYEPDSEEILLFDDGIGVKKQKPNREKRQEIINGELEQGEKEHSRQRVITDVVLLQTQRGSFETLTCPIDNQGQPLIPLEDIIKCKLKYYYNNYEKALPIVAITDGASSIRKRLKILTEKGITLILDWYHLCKKLREFLSMISWNKADKTEHSKFLFFNLWRGNTSEVLNYLQTKIKARNKQRLAELITYITKHEREIINYELRRQVGKTIGSGRMEKRVDLVIGNRQKHKGMSWSELGSRALAILKVTECNGLWKQTWFPQYTN